MPKAPPPPERITSVRDDLLAILPRLPHLHRWRRASLTRKEKECKRQASTTMPHVPHPYRCRLGSLDENVKREGSHATDFGVRSYLASSTKPKRYHVLDSVLLNAATHVSISAPVWLLDAPGHEFNLSLQSRMRNVGYAGTRE